MFMSKNPGISFQVFSFFNVKPAPSLAPSILSFSSIEIQAHPKTKIAMPIKIETHAQVLHIFYLVLFIRLEYD